MTPQREPAVRIAKILFATDFSEVSAKALPYAAAFARRFAAELCVVHVLGDGEPQQDTAAVAQLRREAEARTNRLLEGAHFRGVRHQVVLAEGEILPALASVAEQRGADLLVLGMHGRHGLAKALLGSVADEILRLAQVPVLVVGSEVSVPAEEELRVHRVLYAADFSPGCGRALQYAGAIAQASMRGCLCCMWSKTSGRSRRRRGCGQKNTCESDCWKRGGWPPSIQLSPSC